MNGAKEHTHQVCLHVGFSAVSKTRPHVFPAGGSESQTREERKASSFPVHAGTSAAACWSIYSLSRSSGPLSLLHQTPVRIQQKPQLCPRKKKKYSTDIQTHFLYVVFQETEEGPGAPWYNTNDRLGSKSSKNQGVVLSLAKEIFKYAQNQREMYKKPPQTQ